MNEKNLLRQFETERSSELNEVWSEVVSKDPNLDNKELYWYLKPALWWCSRHQDWREVEGFEGVIDRSFPQPAASTSTVQRMILPDGSTRILKELKADSIVYIDSSVAQAMNLAGEQAIGVLQSAQNSAQKNERPFYQGVFSLRDKGEGVLLEPYEIQDEGRVIGVMREVNSKHTLALQLFSPSCPSKMELNRIFGELTHRAMNIEIPMPSAIKDRFSSEEYIEARIFEHTPGKLSRGEMGGQFDFLQDEGIAFVESASYLLERDSELLDYLMGEEYARRGGDMRAVNTILSDEGDIEVVLDQINLLLDPVKWGDTGKVSIAPWGMNPPTYEAAFLIPDLIASDHESVAQVVVDSLATYQDEFSDLSWNDLSSVPIRALRFWTAMKAIETAGLSTLNIEDGRIGTEERLYLTRAIFEYGGIALKLLESVE